MKDLAFTWRMLLSWRTRSGAEVVNMFTIPPLFFRLFLANFFHFFAQGVYYEPEFAGPMENITVPLGRDIRFACTVRHLGNYKVAWIHFEKSAILTVHNNVITRNPRIGVSHDHHRTWYLHLNNIEESDAGRYLCQINTPQAKTQSAYLTVVVAPTIDDSMSSSDVIVREGSDVTLQCSARGSPDPAVKWRREDGQPVAINKTFSSLEKVGPVLELQKINRVNMGAYLCIASNGIAPSVSKRIFVSVDFPPMIWVPHQLIGARLGSMVSIDCLLESHPAALHYWSLQNGQVLHDPDKYRMESFPIDSSNRRINTSPVEAASFQNPSYKTHLKLTIRNLRRADFGLYRCVAKNPRGETDGIIKIYQIAREIEEEESNEADNATFEKSNKKDAEMTAQQQARQNLTFLTDRSDRTNHKKNAKNSAEKSRFSISLVIIAKIFTLIIVHN